MFLVVVTVTLWILLVVVASVRPRPSLLSHFELERRAKHTKTSKEELRREQLLAGVLVLQRVLVALLLVIITLLLITALGMAWGATLAIISAALSALVAQWPWLNRVSTKLYGALEPRLLWLVERSTPALLRKGNQFEGDPYHRFDSREELERLIAQAGEVLSDNERRLMIHTLQFADKKIADIMTPRDDIIYIKKTEFLGPLVLDELHKQGHSRLPVIGKDLDHVVGVLHLSDLLALDIRRSTTAEKAMEDKVLYIHKDDSLEHALAAFLKHKHLLFIVVNDKSETVGLLCLEDIIAALVGRKLFDDDDNHYDSGTIAAR